MTLSEAIAVIGNDTASPPARGQAAERVLTYLRGLVGRHGASDALEEAAQVVTFRLYTNRRPPLDNPSDAAASRYLRKALFLEARAGNEPTVSLTTEDGEIDVRCDTDAYDQLVGWAETLENDATVDGQLESAQEAHDWLHRRAIPGVASSHRYPDRLRERLEELRMVVAGETTVEAIVLAESPGADAESQRRAQTTRNQHHSRARAAVHSYLDSLPDEPRTALARTLFDMQFRVRRKVP